MKSSFAIYMFLVVVTAPIGPHAAVGSIVTFINEFHYDNVGGDVSEFVEIAGLAGTDLTNWSVVLYNGSDGEVYNSIFLSGTIDDEGSGYGALEFFHSGIQNGSPDGLALVDNNDVVQEFLSYEGAFIATNGPAIGLTSMDVGVFETTGTAIGQSLQRVGGPGQLASDFSWSGPTNDSPGSINAQQQFSSIPEPATATTWFSLAMVSVLLVRRRK